MKSEVMLIGPQQAKEWLERKAKNRNFNQKHIDYLANEIKMGRWRLTHQGIAFNDKGELIDGQHRLAAIIKAGIAVSMFVTCGVTTDRFPIMDRGLPRNLSFITGLPRSYSEIYTFILMISVSKNTRPSPDDLLLLNSSLSTHVAAVQGSTNSSVPFFSAASIRSAAVIALRSGDNSSYILDTYRRLVLQSPSDLKALPSVALALIKSHNRESKEDRVTYAGTSGRTLLYLRARYIFTPSNSDSTVIRIGDDIKTRYLKEVHDIVDSILNSTEDAIKRKLEEAVKVKDQKIRIIQNQLMKERAQRIDSEQTRLSMEASS